MKPALWMAGVVLSCVAAVGIVLYEKGHNDVALAEKCRQIDAAAIGAIDARGEWVEAGGPAGSPAHCRVSATLSPVAGSRIGVVFRLPAGWNGKLLGLGGGGWAGNVLPEPAAPGLAAGYATLQTDGGHRGTDVWDNRWAANAVAADDFAWRAVHEMTLAGKAMAVAYYGKRAKRAYFDGCSTGGRQALIEAQRFPGDYNGIVAGAPVYSLQVQTSQLLRSNLFSAPGAALDQSHVALVTQAVLAACDAGDGAKDGIIADPRACHWDPGALACKPGEPAGECLSAPQVAALSTAYSGVLAPDGSWAQWPLSRGGEAVWKPFIALDGVKAPGTDGGIGTLAGQLYGTRKVDFGRLAPRDVVQARLSAFAKNYEAVDPDLSGFFRGGGKLLIDQGEYDAGPSPVGAIDYVTAVTRRAPADAANGLRLFLMPGMAHCRGGPGADQVDWLTAIDRWVSSGNAPGQVVATKKGSPLTRPVCAWPEVARYKGAGDSNDPASYSCVARERS